MLGFQSDDLIVRAQDGGQGGVGADGDLEAAIPLPQSIGGPWNGWLLVAPRLEVDWDLWGSVRGRLDPHYQDHGVLSGGAALRSPGSLLAMQPLLGQS